MGRSGLPKRPPPPPKITPNHRDCLFISLCDPSFSHDNNKEKKQICSRDGNWNAMTSRGHEWASYCSNTKPHNSPKNLAAVDVNQNVKVLYNVLDKLYVTADKSTYRIHTPVVAQS